MGTGLPIGLQSVTALGAMQPRNDPGLIEHRRAFGPIDAGKKAGLTRCRKPRAGAIEVTHIVVAFVFFEKPTPCKRIPRNGLYPATSGFDLPLNPALIDKMQRDPDRDHGYRAGRNNSNIHQ